MIECHQLSKRFLDFIAVSDVSFTVPAGTIAALLGPNGAGKSTTLKLLSGLLIPTGGSATIAGFDLQKEPLAVRQVLGVVPETLGLFDDLSIEEHLRLTGSLYHLQPKDTAHRAEQLLDLLGLTEGARTFLRDSSYGMRKKTALAMALLPNPAVLVLDEPFEGIDPSTARAVYDLLATTAKRGTTILFTSHLLPVVQRLADVVMVMRQGELVWQARREQIDSLEDEYFSLIGEAPLPALDWLGRNRA